MRALAIEGHSRADELRRAADELDAIPTDDTKRLVSAWARARKLWCEVSGEELVPGTADAVMRLFEALKKARRARNA